jgi:CheY-specific phosphatase CheX
MISITVVLKGNNPRQFIFEDLTEDEAGRLISKIEEAMKLNFLLRLSKSRFDELGEITTIGNNVLYFSVHRN